MIKAHKIRLHPTPEQATYFAKAAGTARYAFNWAVAEWKKQYESGGKPSALLTEAQTLAKSLAGGPTFAHAMTKRCIHQEWSMGIDEAIEAEAQAQAICMMTEDFTRAYEAFVAKQRPLFQGN